MYSRAGCLYCLHAEFILKSKGMTDIERIRVDLEPGRREEMVRMTGRRTVPQIYVGEVHVGGCADLAALEHAGDLDRLLASYS